MLQKAKNVFDPVRRELIAKATNEGANIEINGIEYVAKKLDDSTERVILTSAKDGVSGLFSKNGYMQTVKSGDTKLYLGQNGGLSQLLKGYSSKDGIKKASNLYDMCQSGCGTIKRQVELVNTGEIVSPIKGYKGEHIGLKFVDDGLKISDYSNPTSEIGILKQGDFLDEGIVGHCGKYKFDVGADGTIKKLETIQK